MKKQNAIILGSTVTIASAITTKIIFNYFQTKPKDLDSFQIEAASGINLKIKDKWESTSLFFGKNNKEEKILMINLIDKTIVVFVKRIKKIEILNKNEVNLFVKNPYGKIEKIALQCEPNDFGQAFFKEFIRFLIENNK